VSFKNTFVFDFITRLCFASIKGFSEKKQEKEAKKKGERKTISPHEKIELY